MTAAARESWTRVSVNVISILCPRKGLDLLLNTDLLDQQIGDLIRTTIIVDEVFVQQYVDIRSGSFAILR